MLPSTQQSAVPGQVATVAARLASAYQTAAHDVVLPLVGEISPPPTPPARSFRDRVHSPLGRFIARFLARWLILAPLPQPVQQLALLWPVSILAPFANALEEQQEQLGESRPTTDAESPVSARPAACCVKNAVPLLPASLYSLEGVLTRNQPEFLGYVPNVGGKLAFGESSSILFGTAYSRFGGADTTNGLNGVRTAALGEMTVITKVVPAVIPVSAGLEVFRDVDISYKVIPPGPNEGEVRIDVKDGGRVATLPAAIDTAGSGTTRWAQGAIIDPARTYEARLHTEREGQPVPSLPRRLKFDRVPLAITTKDRILRIQFALAEQGMFTERHYGVKVYVTAPGSDFGTTPAFHLTSQQIEESYSNTEVWWDDLAERTDKANAAWVTRKIDRLTLVQGTNDFIRRQAFEIGVIFGTYPKVKVEIVSEDTGKVLEYKEGTVTADAAWSEAIERAVDHIRTARGDVVPNEPILPDPNVFNPLRVAANVGGLAFRALYWALEEEQLPFHFLAGLLDGFVEGWKGDIGTVVEVARAAASPVESAKAMGEFLKEFWRNLTWDNVNGIFRVMLDRMTGVTWHDAAYYAGYIVGFLGEQLLVGVLLFFASTPIGLAAQKAAVLLRGVGWIASLTLKAQRFVRALTYALHGVKSLTTDTAAAKATMRWLKEAARAVDEIWDKYPNAGRIMEKAGRVGLVSQQAAKRALHWLTVVDRMTEDAAQRLVQFFAKHGPDVGDRWFAKWIELRNGRRAVKDAFEAYDGTGDLADGSHHVLVVAAGLDHPVAGRNWAKELVEKYRNTAQGDRVESATLRMKRSFDDDRFSDETIGYTSRDLSHQNAPALSDDAVESTTVGNAAECLIR